MWIRVVRTEPREWTTSQKAVAALCDITTIQRPVDNGDDQCFRELRKIEARKKYLLPLSNDCVLLRELSVLSIVSLARRKRKREEEATKSAIWACSVSRRLWSFSDARLAGEGREGDQLIHTFQHIYRLNLYLLLLWHHWCFIMYYLLLFRLGIYFAWHFERVSRWVTVWVCAVGCCLLVWSQFVVSFLVRFWHDYETLL